MATTTERVEYIFEGMVDSLKKAATTATNLLNKYSEATQRVRDRVDSMNRSVNHASVGFKRLSRAITGITIGKQLAKATHESIKYIENLNLFTVAMGNSIDQGMKFVDTMQEVYGMDPSNLYRYAGYFYQLTDAIGMTDEASASMSLSSTKAANDIASLFNMPIEKVVQDLASGMQGMSRAVRKYGMDIRVTTLQQTALSLGMTDNVKTTSEANRMALRYVTMLRQVENALKQNTKVVDGATIAMGDFARNIETPANQLRIFKEQISQLGRAIGNFFVKPLAVAIQYINGFVMALRTILEFVGGLLGLIEDRTNSFDPGPADDVADSIGGIGDAASDASKKMKNLLAPIDELNILKEDTGSGADAAGFDDSLNPALLEEIKNMELSLENIKMKANQVRDSILEFLGFKVDMGKIISWDPKQFEENLINKFPQWSETITAAFANWNAIVAGFQAVFSALGNVIGLIAQKLSDFFSLFINDTSVSTFIESLSGGLQGLADWINEHSETLANLAMLLLGVVAAFKAFAIISTVIGFLAGVAQVAATVIGAMNPLVLLIGAVAGAFLYLYATNEDFANGVKQILGSLWNSFLKPILEAVGTHLKQLWDSTIKPLAEQLYRIFQTIGELVGALWGNVLAPFIDWIVSSLGPNIAGVLSTVIDAWHRFKDDIGDVVSGVLTMLQGILDFMVGVFTGDWERIWKSISNIVRGFMNAVIGFVEGAINLVISGVNGLISILYNALVGFVNLIMGSIKKLLDLVGIDLDLRIQGQPPKIPALSIPKLPELAQGGVVTGPTYLMAGEGRYDEAIIPLGNSPQMSAMVEQIASKVGNDQVVATLRELITEVRNKDMNSYLDGHKVSVYMHKHNAQVDREFGPNLVRRGG